MENNAKEEEIKIKNEKLREELNQLISDYDIQIKTLKNKVLDHENNIIPKMKHSDTEGLDITPIGNPYGFKFRNENKDKWNSKRGFQLY